MSYAAAARRFRVPVGFVVAVLYVLLARPSWRSILYGSIIILPALLLRTAASGHVKKNQEVTTSGPYAYTRNPLYLGSMILMIGFGVASQNWWLAASLVIVFIALYWPVMRVEEHYLRQQFPEFESYAQRVPRILPRARAQGTSSAAFSPELYRKHREYNAALGSVGMMILLILKLKFLSR
ncbi:MAG: methyltransferase family protein [Terriglobales bacterium]|jgi:protein-S-isoprenylcysteine O-methyltransferase Ste14